jgi:hypothetical protein
MTEEQAKKEPPAWFKAVVTVAVFGGGYWFYRHSLTTGMDDVHNQVAADAVARYEIAKRQGDPMQTCVQAGMVSAAFLQAKDEANYTRWKATEQTDCAQAGMARP